jgi:hypothetical protein
LPGTYPEMKIGFRRKCVRVKPKGTRAEHRDPKITSPSFYPYPLMASTVGIKVMPLGHLIRLAITII